MTKFKFKKIVAFILVGCILLSNLQLMLTNAADTVEEDAITSITVEGVGNGVSLWQGFEISPYDYDIAVTYESGTVEKIPMTVDMIGDYDNITVGTRDVVITYMDVSTKVSLTINERKSEIEAFGTSVEEHVDAKNITLNGHTESIRELETKYNSFSGYEVSFLDNAVIEKYEQLLDALYRLEHPELAVYDTVYTEDFNKYLYDEDWTIYSDQSSGSWRTFNSILVNEQLRYGWTSEDKKSSYLDYANFYGEVNSVEADIYVPSDEIGWYASILSCVNKDGFYMARIYYTGTSTEGYGKIQLLKCEDGNYDTLYSTNALRWVGLNRKTLVKDAWNNLRLTVIDGVLKVYLNDTQMITYSDNTFAKGTFGFRSNYGDMRYDSLRVMGTRMDLEEYEPQIRETSFEDSFEDQTYVAGGEPKFWIEETNADQWKLFDLENNGNLSYGTNSMEYGYTWLHTFESDPTVEMKFMVDNVTEEGRVEFLTRYAGTMECYAGVGYDFSQSKWYIYTDKGVDFEFRKFYAEDTITLTEKSWHKIKIQEEGRYIQVFVDDMLVVEDTEASMTGYGRVGVLSEGANLYIDDFSYTMPHGGNVSDGVNEILFDYATYGVMSHMQVEAVGDGMLLGVNGASNRFLSSDNGLTWSKTTDTYTSVKGKGLAYPNILKLEGDTYLMVYADTFTVWKSTDGMKTWKELGKISEDIGTNKTEDGQWIHVLHVNSLTKATVINDEGKEIERIFLPVGVRRFSNTSITGHYTRVFYSDDYGKSWKESANNTSAINPTYEEEGTGYSSWCESKIIMGSDSVLRMYNTREYECTVYTESHDYGVTWEGIYSVPYLQNAISSYGIAQDPETGIYYMACLNDVANRYNSILPRTRLSLVQSTDGKNWTFVMDVERFTSCANYLSSEIYQILDPSISIIDGYMYITMGRSYAASSGHNKQAIRMVRLDMGKLPQPSEWDDANIADATRTEKLEISTEPKMYYELGETFTLDGGVVKATAFNGVETYYDMDEFRMITDTPDMAKNGVYEVILMNEYAQTVSFDVKVGAETCQVEWRIHGKGKVSSQDNVLYEGQNKTFTVTVENGWKLGCVMVNGEAVEVTNNRFTITATNDMKIDVICVEKETSNNHYYYKDAFNEEKSYVDAIDSKNEGVSNWDWSKNNLNIVEKGNKFTLFGGINVNKNYTISADVEVPKNDYLGVVAYGSANAKKTDTYGYEFAIYNNMFRLYSRGSSGGSVLPSGDATPAITSYFPEYASGDNITLSLSAITTGLDRNVLICKATYNKVTKTIFVVTDNQYCSGLAGIRGNSAGSKVNCVSITNVEPLLEENISCNSGDTGCVSRQFEASNVEGVSLKDYIYEADITLTDVMFAQGGSGSASLCVGVTSESARNGFEFGIYQESEDGLSVKLYDCSKDTAVYSALCEEATQAYKNGENVHLKMVVRGNRIRCYVNSTYVCEYDANSEIVGNVGVYGEYAVSFFENIHLTVIQDNYMEVDAYRSGETYTVPIATGYDDCVFAGWYLDGSFKTPLDSEAKIADAYAKWVSKEVLSVKAQLPSGQIVDDNGRTIMRIVTTTDCADYAETGFDVSTVNQSKTYTDTRLFTKIKAKPEYSSIAVDYTPQEAFHKESKYFSTIVLYNLKATDEHLTKEFTIKPFWVTADGTKVYGVTRVLTIQEGIDAIVSPMSS